MRFGRISPGSADRMNPVFGMARASTAAAMARADRLSERDGRLVRAIVSARRGDAQAERLFREFVADYPDDLEAWQHSLRARVAMIGDKPAEALHQLDRADWAPIESSFEEEALDRYLRANLLQALGRDAEALNGYRTIAERATHEVMYVARSRLRQSLIAGALDDQRESAEAYPVAARLWANAAPSLREQVAATSRRLRQLGIQVPDTGHAIRR